jgi:hypothetical protein
MEEKTKPLSAHMCIRGRKGKERKGKERKGKERKRNTCA